MLELRKRGRKTIPLLIRIQGKRIFFEGKKKAVAMLKILGRGGVMKGYSMVIGKGGLVIVSFHGQVSRGMSVIGRESAKERTHSCLFKKERSSSSEEERRKEQSVSTVLLGFPPRFESLNREEKKKNGFSELGVILDSRGRIRSLFLEAGTIFIEKKKRKERARRDRLPNLGKTRLVQQREARGGAEAPSVKRRSLNHATLLDAEKKKPRRVGPALLLRRKKGDMEKTEGGEEPGRFGILINPDTRKKQ